MVVCRCQFATLLSAPPVCSDWTGLYCTRSGGVASAYGLHTVHSQRLSSDPAGSPEESRIWAVYPFIHHYLGCFFCCLFFTIKWIPPLPRVLGATLLCIAAWLWMHHEARCETQCNSLTRCPMMLTAPFMWGWETWNLLPEHMCSCGREPLAVRMRDVLSGSQ